MSTRAAIFGCRPPPPGSSAADHELYRFILADVRRHCLELDDHILVSGGAEGVDSYAEEFFGHFSIHRPDYAKYGPRRAPLERNTLIVRDGETFDAWPAPWSRGTWDTVRKARAAGKPCTVHRVAGPDGMLSVPRDISLKFDFDARGVSELACKITSIKTPVRA